MNIIEKISKWGMYKTKLNGVTKLFSPILGGMFIALGALSSIIISNGIAISGISKLMGALIFPVGLIFIVFTGADLFTGNCLLIISYKNKYIHFMDMIINWIFVYLGNFIGSIIMSVMIYYSGLLQRLKIDKIFITMDNTKVGLSYNKLIILGILCNMLVCLAIFMYHKYDGVLSLILLYLPIVVFVLCGFEHSVANMFFLSVGNLLGVINIQLIMYNLLYVTIGNIIGGVFIGLIYYYFYREQRIK